VPNSPGDEDVRQRLALIQRLWDELQATHENTPKYHALIEQIRRETDAFRQALDPKEPTP
jgi:hypothetical protein